MAACLSPLLQMLCFYAAYFSYLIMSCYYYYEKMNERSLFSLENFVELHWVFFNSLCHFCIIGTSVTLHREVDVTVSGWNYCG